MEELNIPVVTADVEFKSVSFTVSCLSDRCGSKGDPVLTV